MAQCYRLHVRLYPNRFSDHKEIVEFLVGAQKHGQRSMIGRHVEAALLAYVRAHQKGRLNWPIEIPRKTQTPDEPIQTQVSRRPSEDPVDFLDPHLSHDPGQWPNDDIFPEKTPAFPEIPLTSHSNAPPVHHKVMEPQDDNNVSFEKDGRARLRDLVRNIHNQVDIKDDRTKDR